MKTQAINTPSNWRDLKRHPLSAEYPDLPPEEGGNRMRAGCAHTTYKKHKIAPLDCNYCEFSNSR